MARGQMSGVMDNMENTTTTTEEQTHRDRSPELVRPVEGRMIAGVARGIADNFGISEWIPRVFFIVTAFVGGFGLALYAAGWAFIRSEDEEESPAERFFSDASGSTAWIGVGLIVVAGVIILANFTFISGEVIWAGALLVVGLLLYLGYIPNGNRSQTTSDESKEGVQPMTNTTETSSRLLEEDATVDSPVGGTPEPPPPPAPPNPAMPPAPPAPPRERSILGRLTVGITLLGLATLAILDNIPSVPIDADPRHYLALAVTIFGVGLLVGAFAGRARWLIVAGVIMIPTLIFSPFFEYDLSSDAFDRYVEPATFLALETEYSLDVGNLVIDLTDLPWNGQTIEMAASVDIGNIEVRVPNGVAVSGQGTVDIGRVASPGGESFGFGDPLVEFSIPGSEGEVVLDLEVNVGNIEVHSR